MSKRAITISLKCILSAAIIMMAADVVSGRKPYKDLEAVQIASATVELLPPYKTIQIADIKELVDLLKDVVILNEDNSYTECDGQGVIFTLVMTDGTQTSIMAYNPFLVIDGVGYKTKYEPCEALNRYANRLLDEGDAFGEEPDTILSVRCWSDEHWSDPAADSENVSVNGNEIELMVEQFRECPDTGMDSDVFAELCGRICESNTIYPAFYLVFPYMVEIAMGQPPAQAGELGCCL